MLGLVPASLGILILMGHLNYLASSEFITLALERPSRIHAAATGHAVEEYLEKCRRHLLEAARSPASAPTMRSFLERWRVVSGMEYVEFSYLPRGQGEPLTFVSHAGRTVRLSPDEARNIRPAILTHVDQLACLQQGELWISAFHEMDYPVPSTETVFAQVVRPVLRMATPCLSEDGVVAGYLHLAVDVGNLRDILTLYQSSDSPVFAFSRSPKFPRFTFFFDTEGWALFESDATNATQSELSTLSVRETFSGTLGRPGFPGAFRPSQLESVFWKILEDTRAGRQGLARQTETATALYGRHSLAYSPVRVVVSPHRPAKVIGGVVYEDRSVLVDLAGYRHLDILLLISAISVLALLGVIAVVTRSTSRGLMELAAAVQAQSVGGQWREVHLADGGYETEVLKNAINSMIRTIREQLEEIRTKDREIESVSLKEPVSEVFENPGHPIDEVFPEFIGSGPFMHRMKSDIVKAAQVDVDVLIEGETGTGKQLAAEAVHRLSRRVEQPFISINCGELDENLLLDSLFGHIKGAFTDGKTERRGAFLEADGGTLFLDEIQSASLKVQQALLRALSLRKIRPLGSDKDVDVDVRLITATNADLRGLMASGTFREDLYYRLKVVTIQTPALRDHRQNIPPLALHFLQEGEHMAGKTGLRLSRGAMEKLVAYSWPGNIRELKHCIITAAVMSESKVIQAEHLGIEAPAGAYSEAGHGLERSQKPNGAGGSFFPNEMTRTDRTAQAPTAEGDGLTPRQTLAYEHAVRHGGITSKHLLGLLGREVSKRTANYDLQRLVELGLLVKVGRGPATRYLVARRGAEDRDGGAQ